MNAMENLLARRSIRSYTGKLPTKEQMEIILQAAYAAPIGMGRYDSVRITVVTDSTFLSELESACAAQRGEENYHPLYGAPMLIILSSVFPGIPTDNSSYSNTAIISQNIALAATHLGLGACHIWGAIRTLNTQSNLLAKLNLPAGFAPCCAVALGHTQETYSIESARKHTMETTRLDG